MIKTLLGLLVSSSLSSGMIPRFPPPPAPGSLDRPIPPDDYFGSGDYRMPSDNPMAEDSVHLVHSKNPSARGGNSMSYGYPTPSDGYPMQPDPFPGPSDGYPMPPNPTKWNMTGGMRSSPDGGESGPDLSNCERMPWLCCSLCNGGQKGHKGDRGDRGLTGRPGSPGRRGLTGFRGRPGFMGRQGLKGQKGDDGEKGERGQMGFSGVKGGRGFKGDKGDNGDEGKSGAMGPQGEAGLCPDTCLSVPGRAGEAGLPGMMGARGLPGVAGRPGVRGPKGDMGDSGVTGAPGADGSKGDQGAKGECDCQDGMDGAAGQHGPPGATGDKGEMGLKGTSGADGDKGDKGDFGMRGIPGPCSPAIQSSFSAALSATFPLPNMPVPFTRVITNRQMHYNPFSGKYRAPINGTYVFSYHLVVFKRILKVGLFHNFVPVVKSTESINQGTASHQVVLHLDLGDQVWLQVKDGNTNGMYANSESSSTFSGFLLYPDNCHVVLSRDIIEPITGSYSWGTIEAPPTPVP